MIGATKRWLRRNRTNFAIGFGVLGASYLVGQYAISKFLEMRERSQNERIARENLRRRFRQNQEDCTFTVLALLPTATENILEALPVENITHELQQQKRDRPGRSAGASDVGTSEFSSGSPGAGADDGKSVGSIGGESYIHTSQMGASALGSSGTMPQARKSKAQLWDELKISSITRSFTLIYTLALLTIFTRLQLNLLGRRSYVSSVYSLAAPRRNDSTISLENHEDSRSREVEGADFETNRNFLAFSWWLLHRGWRDIQTKVDEAVKEVFGSISPREEITFQRLSELIIETRKKIEGTTEEERRTKKWLTYLLPPPDRELYVLHESGVLPNSQSTSPSNESPSTDDPGISFNPSIDQSAPAPEPSSPTQPSHPQDQDPISPPLRRLLSETADLIDSPQSTRVTTLLLDALFSRLTDTAIRTQAYKSPFFPTPQEQEEGLGLSVPPPPPPPLQMQTKLATILAVITRQAAQIGNGVPNEYVQAMEGVSELEALGAVVFTTREDLSPDASHPATTSLAEEMGSSGVVGGGEKHVLDPGVDTREGEGGIIGSTWGVFEGVWGRVAGAVGSAAGR